MGNNYKKTITASFLGCITQAIIVNFAPLMYMHFRSTLGVEVYEITLLIVVIFGIQLITDIVASKYVVKIGYRKCIVSAHLLCAVGFILMTILPYAMDGFIGLLISAIIYGVGAGLLEVMLSPIVESCPTKNKASIMSFLHSFYCWGVVATILISTLFFLLFDINNWKYLVYFFALVPIANAILFSKVPLYQVDSEDSHKSAFKNLFIQKPFWIMLIIMVCAGASEQAISQWASTAAETSMNVSKTFGDLIGVCGFASMMGLSRLFYAKFANKISLRKAIFSSAILCLISFLLIGLSNNNILGLVGYGLAGLSIGLFWPGTFSLSSKIILNGGTAMFGMLALAGDIGCIVGPAIVGGVAGAFNSDFKLGILLTTFFPLTMIVAILIHKFKLNKKT